MSPVTLLEPHIGDTLFGDDGIQSDPSGQFESDGRIHRTVLYPLYRPIQDITGAEFHPLYILANDHQWRLDDGIRRNARLKPKSFDTLVCYYRN